MTTTRMLLLYSLCLLCIGINALSAELSECLNLATYHKHRIEKEAAIRFCFNKFKSSQSRENCHSLVDKKVSQLGSIRLTEDMRSICFYDTPPTTSLSSCLKDSRKFRSAGNHDEGVFYCYQQFQEKLSQRDCLKTAKAMIFPAKQSYLEQHCKENESTN